MCIGLHLKHSLFFSDFNDTLTFSTYFPKSQISNFIKILPVPAKVFHAERRDRTKLIVVFSKVANASKTAPALIFDNEVVCCVCLYSLLYANLFRHFIFVTSFRYSVLTCKSCRSTRTS